MDNCQSLLDREPHQPALQALRPAARHMAEALRTGSCPADRFFDRFLPDDLRVVSGEYWTPLAVAKRVAEWLDALNVRTVVDIGSGAGKFCAVAALVGDFRVTGLEQRPSLVAAARALARTFDLQDRVSFVEGALGAVPVPRADAYYLFNPFGPYCIGSDRDVPASAGFEDGRFAHDVAVVEKLLRRAPAGTCVVTYNGFGGRVPADYRQLRVDRTSQAALRLWRKKRNAGRATA